MGSSAQISTGVCWCGSQEQVPEEGSGRFRRVPAYAGVGSGGSFRKVPKGWFRKVLESSGGFRRVPARVGVGFGKFRRVPKSSGECWYRIGGKGSEGSGEFRCGLLPCNLDRSSHVIVLITRITLSQGIRLLLLGISPKLIFWTKIWVEQAMSSIQFPGSRSRGAGLRGARAAGQGKLWKSRMDW